MNIIIRFKHWINANMYCFSVYFQFFFNSKKIARFLKIVLYRTIYYTLIAKGILMVNRIFYIPIQICFMYLLRIYTYFLYLNDPKIRFLEYAQCLHQSFHECRSICEDDFYLDLIRTSNTQNENAFKKQLIWFDFLMIKILARA